MARDRADDRMMRRVAIGMTGYRRSGDTGGRSLLYEDEQSLLELAGGPGPGHATLARLAEEAATLGRIDDSWERTRKRRRLGDQLIRVILAAISGR
jgi:hypothetical protein